MCLCVPMYGQRAERELRGWLAEIRTLRPKRHEKGREIAGILPVDTGPTPAAISRH